MGVEDSIFGLGQSVDGLTVATPLGQAATTGSVPAFNMDMITGLIPGSIGETSVIAIPIGAVILLWTGVASWKTMISVFVGGAFMAWVFNSIGMENNTMAQMPWYEHLVLGGFCFGAVFMATDPVTSARTERGKYIFGFLDRCDGYRYPRTESGLSGRYDACHPADEHLRSAD